MGTKTKITVPKNSLGGVQLDSILYFDGTSKGQCVPWVKLKVKF